MPSLKGKGSKKSQNKKMDKQKFEITIIKERCKGCKLCVIYCPTETLEMTEELNFNGYFVPEVIDIIRCKGCNLCTKICPDFAIFCSKNKK